jgi:hypothetical protein
MKNSAAENAIYGKDCAVVINNRQHTLNPYFLLDKKQERKKSFEVQDPCFT